MSFTTFTIPKRRGGRRLIHNPCQECRVKQSELKKLLDKIPVSPFTHAYVKGRSTITSCLPHVGKKFILKLDIKSFFECITHKNLTANLFEGDAANYIFNSIEHDRLDVKDKVVKLFEELRKWCFLPRTEYPDGEYFLPQGFITSPVISNIYMIKTDWGIAKFVYKHYQAEYTRYADDILISSDSKEILSKGVEAIETFLKTVFLKLNKRKTRFMRNGTPKKALGLSFEKKLNVPRRLGKNLRAAQFQVRQGRKMDSTLKGELSYVHGVRNSKKASYGISYYMTKWKIRDLAEKGETF